MLTEWQEKIEQQAKSLGLDFFPTIYEVVGFEEMSEIAAYGGFPTRYHHWRFGQESLKMKKSYRYGLHKIYEMVINNNPCYAYLLEANQPIDHKVVIAHVCGHCDFFKNNAWFAHTNRNMLDETGNHAAKVEAIREIEGREEVDRFIDWGLSIDNLIDIYAPFINRSQKARQADKKKGTKTPGRLEPQEDLAAYMEEFINPLEYLDRQRDIQDKREELKKRIEKGLKVPAKPTRDVMLFLLEQAALEEWQQTILSIIREEAYYFAPQAQTKIMNEGWAKYWDRQIIVETGIAESQEIIDDAEHSAGTLQKSMGRINPYKLGFELWKDIEFRWNTGRRGKIWEECNIVTVRKNWDEFVIFKNLWEETNHNRGVVKNHWAEWQGFKQAVKDGKTDFPPELFSPEQYIMLWQKQGCSFPEMCKTANPPPQEWFDYAQRYPGKIAVGLGRKEMFEVRAVHNDITFIGEFFTEEFARQHDYFTYKPGGGGVMPNHWGIDSREFKKVKAATLFGISNAHHPVIELTDANHQNNEELFLKHSFEGVHLDIEKMKGALEALFHLWGKNKTVHLTTVVLDEKPKLPWWHYWGPPGTDADEEEEEPKGTVVIYSYDGKHHNYREIEQVTFSAPF